MRTGVWNGSRPVVAPALLRWLRAQTEPQTAADMSAAIGCHPRSVHVVLRRLWGQRKVEVVGRADRDTPGPALRLWRAT